MNRSEYDTKLELRTRIDDAIKGRRERNEWNIEINDAKGIRYRYSNREQLSRKK